MLFNAVDRCDVIGHLKSLLERSFRQSRHCPLNPIGVWESILLIQLEGVLRFVGSQMLNFKRKWKYEMKFLHNQFKIREYILMDFALC